jgi:3,4-dihydroxy 2-butanone 4-phosphate synthase/GTP cyclohydrolase II
MIRPRVTVTYAQSLDGCLASGVGAPLALSGPESLSYTHQLRAQHSAILVGIGTVLADDPQLTVRLVEGKNPQPIVLDTQLRFPLSARLLRHPTHKPILITGPQSSEPRRRALEEAGARVVRGPLDSSGRLQLSVVLGLIRSMGFESLMVEGGARVITAFLAEKLVDAVAVTISPRFVGGLRAYDAPVPIALRDVHYQVLGSDVIVEGVPE